MRSQLVVIHRPRQTGPDEPFRNLSSSWILWDTCIRRVAIGPSYDLLVEAQTLPGDEVFRGPLALQFLMETVCGLRSPVRGETEVHGQFREVLEKLNLNHPLYKTLQSIHLDARKVRTAHLRGLGSQSYGSFARRTVKNAVMRGSTEKAEEIHVIGAGGLAREILPWLTKLSLPVKVHVRDVEKHRDLEDKYETVQLRSLEEKPVSGEARVQTLLVTAPVSSGYIGDWLAPRETGLQLVLDYRGESHNDPMRVPATYFSLQDIFREIESTKQKVDAEVEKARLMIQSLCEVD